MLTTNPAPDVPVRTGWVDRGAVDIHFTVLGHDAAPRMLFAQPLMVSGTGATPALLSFVDAGWTVLTLDQRGVGSSRPVTDPNEFRLELMAADLLAVLDAVGWSRCWFAGGSMGAATTLAAAVTAPERAEGLALVAPAFGASPNAGIPQFDEVARAAATGGTDAAVEVKRRQLLDAGAPPSAVDSVLNRIRAIDAPTLACLLSTVPRWSLADQLAALRTFPAPVVVVAWDQDPIHPMAVAEEIVNLAPVSRLQRLASPAVGADPAISFPLLALMMDEARAAGTGEAAAAPPHRPSNGRIRRFRR